MSAAFTPGPWSRNIPPASKYPTIWAGRNKHIAVLVVKPLHDDQLEGNLNLISAAPDLFEALADMRSRFHRALVLSGTDPEFADIACQKADAALAKATGEAA